MAKLWAGLSRLMRFLEDKFEEESIQVDAGLLSVGYTQVSEVLH